MRFFDQWNVNSAVTPVLTIILGLLLIMNPTGVGRGIAVIAGIVLLVSGVIDVARYFMASQAFYNRGSDLIVGIIKCIVGLFAVTRAGRVVSLIVNIAGIFVILNGIKAIGNSLSMRAANMPGWMVSMVFSVLFLLVGISLLMNPFQAVAAVFVFIGILVLLSGIFGLLQWYRMVR